ncbi:multidrug effflux MFS transporter [Candidatus Neoehrlichia procyonis]|uniref:Bcr/CflA family efflux transporter n=1 Tax=Candidatus Neoehrlichia procyonis str. RAC413 TaxID=1359163 RepID=A0A0F3NN89_9RICK|nr:multidrug effflux MFS transporter [Candidatus Neoehrlichia lotoris]KJV69147.1 drug resistance transporter, Bcr/CflA subfamily protein [Candidatus Neoehrlichia lotoris str. RAC413]
MQILKKLILFLVVITITICDMSCDIYTPSLPKISDFFNVGHAVAQLTVSLNLIGGSLSGLLYGPLSDYYGRRPIMLIGIAIFGLASIGCCFVNNIVMLIIMRLIQGCGAGAAGVIGYAVINDMFSGNECAKNISYVNMAIAFSPAIGPILGSSVISRGYDWNALFMIISLLSVILFIFLYVYMKETIVKKYTDNLNFYCVIRKYINLMMNMRFLGFALIYSLTIMWVWASIVNLPFVFIKSMNLPVGNYGYLIAIHVISYVIGTVVNQRLVERAGMNKMLIVGLLLNFVPDIIIVMLHYSSVILTPLLIELIWVPSGVGIAFTIGNSMASAFKETQDSGTGSAFIVFLQTIFGAFGIYIVECFSDGTIVAIAFLPIICSVIAIIIYTALYFTKKKEMC